MAKWFQPHTELVELSHCFCQISRTEQNMDPVTSWCLRFQLPLDPTHGLEQKPYILFMHVHADICVSLDLAWRSREQQPTTLEISVQNSKSSGVREHHFETGLHHKGSEHRWIQTNFWVQGNKQTDQVFCWSMDSVCIFFLSHLFILPYTAERRDGRNFQCCTYISPHTIWASWMSNVNKFDLMLYLTVIYCNYLQLTNIYIYEYIYIYVMQLNWRNSFVGWHLLVFR